MITKKNFIKIMNSLKDEQNKQYDLNDVYKKYGNSNDVYNYDLFDSVIEILYDIFKDIETIDLWIYQLDFGKSFHTGDISDYDPITETNFDVNSNELLYDYLIKKI